MDQELLERLQLLKETAHLRGEQRAKTIRMARRRMHLMHPKAALIGNTFAPGVAIPPPYGKVSGR